MVKLNFGDAASGAAAGGYAGSTFGPWGTAVGAITGGLTGLFGSKKKKKPKSISTLNPQQQELFDQYYQGLQGQGQFSDLYNFDAEGYNNVFDQTIARPAYRNFQENIIPGITGQFRGSNIMNSSYTGESLSRAGRDVQEALDAQRSANIFAGQQQANLNKMRGIENILNMQTFAMQRPQSKKSPLDTIMDQFAEGAGSWALDYIKNMRG